MSKNDPKQAIALKYDGSNAPSLTAKGNDALAEEILSIARAHEVPIYENADLVRLLARLELGDAIPQALYQSVAEIIAFAWYLKGKAPAGFYRQQEHNDATLRLPQPADDSENKTDDP